VLLPGIMGSLLASVRGISAVLWFNPTVVLDGHINLLDLNDDGDAIDRPMSRSRRWASKSSPICA
jgi:hypothetical protein